MGFCYAAVDCYNAPVWRPKSVECRGSASECVSAAPALSPGGFGAPQASSPPGQGCAPQSPGSESDPEVHLSLLCRGTPAVGLGSPRYGQCLGFRRSVCGWWHRQELRMLEVPAEDECQPEVEVEGNALTELVSV